MGDKSKIGLMAKTFLERARELSPENRPSNTIGRMEVNWYGCFSFYDKCWPEILALVEAAELATRRWDEANHEMGQASADERICEALEALDAKAGG